MSKHSAMKLYMGPWPYTSLSYRTNMYTQHTEVRAGCDGEQKIHCSCQESNSSHPDHSQSHYCTTTLLNTMKCFV